MLISKDGSVAVVDSSSNDPYDYGSNNYCIKRTNDSSEFELLICEHETVSIKTKSSFNKRNDKISICKKFYFKKMTKIITHEVLITFF